LGGTRRRKKGRMIRKEGGEGGRKAWGGVGVKKGTRKQHGGKDKTSWKM
jgi:hypothetical protein